MQSNKDRSVMRIDHYEEVTFLGHAMNILSARGKTRVYQRMVRNILRGAR